MITMQHIFIGRIHVSIMKYQHLNINFHLETLQRAKFTLRKQLGQNNLKKVVPYEFPLFPDIEWILEVDIIHPYFLNILEENLNSSEFNGVLIFSPKNKNK